MIRVHFKSHSRSTKIYHIDCPDRATALFIETALFRNHWILIPSKGNADDAS